jgi:hypothetical protein
MRRKIVVHSRSGDVSALDGMVKDWIAENVEAICIVGKNCDEVHFHLDLLISDHEMQNADADRIVTTSHDEETLDEVIAFARETYGEGEPVVVEV